MGTSDLSDMYHSYMNCISLVISMDFGICSFSIQSCLMDKILKEMCIYNICMYTC